MATSGHISAHSLHPVHCSISRISTTRYPDRFIRVLKWMSSLGHVMTQSPQPLQRSRLNFTSAILFNEPIHDFTFCNFYQWLKRIDFVRPEFLPLTWNNGILEWWNIDSKRKLLTDHLYEFPCQEVFYQETNDAFSQNPLFQYSNIPIGAKPPSSL